jgi:hypothetical protein
VDSINGFATYLFDSAIVTNDTFYVGWFQSQNEGIDIGFDRNTDARPHFWFNLGTSWQHSLEEGAVMLRPIVGSREGLINTGIVEQIAVPTWRMYPNPVTDWVNVSGAPHGSRFELFNTLGTVVVAGAVQRERIDFPSLPGGGYVLRITTANGTKSFRIVKP